MSVGLPKPLRLLAESAEDFRILSGLLQDSLLVAQQLRWQKKLGRFFIPLNRFCWETVTGEDEGVFFRVASELEIEGVVLARHKGFQNILSAKSDAASKIANLLAVELAEGPCLRLTFSQGLEISLLGEEKDSASSPQPQHQPQHQPLRARLTDSREVQRTDKLPLHLP